MENEIQIQYAPLLVAEHILDLINKTDLSEDERLLSVEIAKQLVNCPLQKRIIVVSE